MDILKRNNVNVIGNGPETMLFAHGFGCDQHMWRFLTPAFEDAYKIVLFDYVGSGNSDYSAYHPEKYGSLHGYAEDILEICLALSLENVIFVGHSVSSMVGILASITAPQLFRSLVLICPSPCYLNEPGYHGGFNREELEVLMSVMEHNYVGWAGFLAPAVMKNPEMPHLVKELEDSFCSGDPSITKNFAEVTFFSDNRNDLPKVRQATLVIECSDDDIAPAGVAEYVQNNIRNSVLSRIEAPGHCPHMTHPAETISRMKKFLGHETQSGE
jgi:sigma-B regulation protein RsbQ